MCSLGIITRSPNMDVYHIAPNKVSKIRAEENRKGDIKIYDYTRKVGIKKGTQIKHFS